MSIQTEYRRADPRIVTADSLKNRRTIIHYMRHHMYGRFLPRNQLPVMPDKFPMLLCYVHRVTPFSRVCSPVRRPLTACLRAHRRLEINATRTLNNTLEEPAGQAPISPKITHQIWCKPQHSVLCGHHSTMPGIGTSPRPTSTEPS